MLLEVFDTLLAAYGPRFWWPADTPFEVCVGAILTQNTNWGNVEKAIANLKRAGLLSPEGLRDIPTEQLAELIRPAGYFNVKSARLKDFIGWLFSEQRGGLADIFSGDWKELRVDLLQVRGVGPETCDSILLYAGHKPSFVVDSYTKRLFSRLGLISPTASYDEVRNLFMENLPADVELFNEYHALIVEHCKERCRTRPLVRRMLPPGPLRILPEGLIRYFLT
ncbi:MAG: endonuclease III domain-containing protein [Desulfobacterales bacterium]|nr:endonuclease III domain-containing protein [Desulfobacterales bacterium]